MARKPLIEPGLIPAEGDVFSRILANDRERRRQDLPLPPAEAAPPDNDVTTLQVTPVTELQVTNVTPLQAETPEAGRPTPRRRREARARTSDEEPPPPDPQARAERYVKAHDIAAEDKIAVVTVRVSTKLNEYMDRYVERLNRVAPTRHYRKQDAVAAAFAAFFADHPLPPPWRRKFKPRSGPWPSKKPVTL